MILGVMAVVNTTLTLPGIAGFVLTIGAAVDANVLINERIREERARGRRVIQAVEMGYKEASRAIFDANITNVIAAVLMFLFGSGPIRGFAVVLMIGIATSVFTAVTLTRMWVANWLRKARPSRYRDLRDRRHETPQARPRQHQHPLPALAGAVLCHQPAADGGIAGAGVHQGAQPGRRFHRRADDPRDLRAIGGGAGRRTARKVGPLGYGEPIIQQFGKANEISIRMKLPEGAEAGPGPVRSDGAARSPQTIRASHADARIDGVDSVSGKVSGELFSTGMQALLAAMVAIAIYIWVRFEWQFGVGALFALVHDVTLTLGMFALTQMEFDLNIVAAMLTLIGYSLNDTIVVYDRIRENLKKYRRMPMPELLDLSVNETLSRTIVTSLSLLITLLALLLLGPT